MNIELDPRLPQEPDPEVVSELNEEMLERVREVAHSIEDRVRKVTIDDLESEASDGSGEQPAKGENETSADPRSTESPWVENRTPDVSA